MSPDTDEDGTERVGWLELPTDYDINESVKVIRTLRRSGYDVVIEERGIIRKRVGCEIRRSVETDADQEDSP